MTFTGADGHTSIHNLAWLSAQYPIVEWGILIAPGRFGTPRYPGLPWLMELNELHMRLGSHVRVAFHLCGEAARETMGGLTRWLPPPWVRRVQINGFDDTKADDMPRPHDGQRYILQARSEEAIRQTAEYVAYRNDDKKADHGGDWGSPDVLYDASGGRGIAPSAWPKEIPGVRVGYAGGIGLDNVSSVLDDLLAQDRTQDFWIDMESSLRTQHNLFDLDKAHRVLEVVESRNRKLGT